MATMIKVGVDIGQRVDPTAIVVCEVQSRDGGYHYIARHVERLALGTLYPAVVERLVEINSQLCGAHFWVDATGVGQPVVDLLREAGLRLTAVYLTGSDKVAREGGDLRLGKALLVSRLQVLLQSGRIHLPQTPEAQALVDELLNYEIRVNDNAHAQFGAFKTGTHDDLATALGLACWRELREVRSLR